MKAQPPSRTPRSSTNFRPQRPTSNTRDMTPGQELENGVDDIKSTASLPLPPFREKTSFTQRESEMASTETTPQSN